jgi:hypothetical protein
MIRYFLSTAGTCELPVATVAFLELNYVYHLELIIAQTLLSDHGSLDLPVINDYTPPSLPEHARLRQGFFARCLELQGQTGHIFSTTECCQPTCATCSAIGPRDQLFYAAKLSAGVRSIEITKSIRDLQMIFPIFLTVIPLIVSWDSFPFVLSCFSFSAIHRTSIP